MCVMFMPINGICITHIIIITFIAVTSKSIHHHNLHHQRHRVSRAHNGHHTNEEWPRINIARTTLQFMEYLSSLRSTQIVRHHHQRLSDFNANVWLWRVHVAFYAHRIAVQHIWLMVDRLILHSINTNIFRLFLISRIFSTERTYTNQPATQCNCVQCSAYVPNRFRVPNCLDNWLRCALISQYSLIHLFTHISYIFNKKFHVIGDCTAEGKSI